MNRKKILESVFSVLYRHFGHLDWWIDVDPFEVCVGVILTQGTNWRNVEISILNLKEKGFLNPQKIAFLDEDTLSELIKPSGFFKVKAKRLKNFVQFLMSEYDGDMDKMALEETHVLREKLLAIKGIGKESADSILLYGLNKPSMVVDEYTRRTLARIGLIKGNEDYDEIKEFLEKNLGKSVQMYRVFHALIVELAKTYCKKKDPLCTSCPLSKGYCKFYANLLQKNLQSF